MPRIVNAFKYRFQTEILPINEEVLKKSEVLLTNVSRNLADNYGAFSASM